MRMLNQRTTSFSCPWRGQSFHWLLQSSTKVHHLPLRKTGNFFLFFIFLALQGKYVPRVFSKADNSVHQTLPQPAQDATLTICTCKRTELLPYRTGRKKESRDAFQNHWSNFLPSGISHSTFLYNIFLYHLQHMNGKVSFATEHNLGLYSYRERDLSWCFLCILKRTTRK